MKREGYNKIRERKKNRKEEAELRKYMTRQMLIEEIEALLLVLMAANGATAQNGRGEGSES